MKRGSLFLWLGASAALLILLALVLAAFGLRSIFDREIERRAAGELSQIVRTLAAQVRIAPGGAPALDAVPSDPRFDVPNGGIYWQITPATGPALRSRSLWEYVLKTKDFAAQAERHVIAMDGPEGAKLIAVTQSISVPSEGGADVPLQLTAALDRSDIAASQRSFARLLAISIAALGLVLVLAMGTFIHLALRPFGKLKRQLQTIHSGASRRVEGRFPTEVQNLVDDLNRFIALNDAAIERARMQAGDLAHGLKTPLTVLAAVARQARANGRDDLSEPIEEQVQQMRRQVDRVLARARAGIGASYAQKPIRAADIAEKVLRAFERLPDAKALRWEREIDASAIFAGDGGDLTEMLGNLLDNARKWASGCVRLSVAGPRGSLTVRVEDDGPGLDPEKAQQITRGRRWDEAQPGTGFGLAIARDLVEAYAGTMELGRSSLGGLSVTLTFPAEKRG